MKKNSTKLRGKQVHGMLLLQLLCTIVGNNNNFYVSRQACVCLHSLSFPPPCTHWHTQLVTVLCAWFRFVFTFLRASIEKNFYAQRTMDMNCGQGGAGNGQQRRCRWWWWWWWRQQQWDPSASPELHGASPHCHHALRQTERGDGAQNEAAMAMAMRRGAHVSR